MPGSKIILLASICALLVVSVFYFTNRPEEVVYEAEEDSGLVVLEEGRRPTSEGAELILFAEREAGAEAEPTDYLVREALNKYLEIKDSAEPVSEEALREAFRPDFSTVFPEEIRELTLNDVRVSATTSQQAKDDYFHRLEEILLESSPDQDLENEYVVFLRYLDTKDERELEKIDPVLNGYREMLNGVLETEAPADIAEEHLQFANALNTLVINIEAFRFYPENSIAGFISLGQYGNVTLNLAASLDGLFKALLS